jgi:hypothetical protein
MCQIRAVRECRAALFSPGAKWQQFRPETALSTGLSRHTSRRGTTRARAKAAAARSGGAIRMVETCEADV